MDKNTTIVLGFTDYEVQARRLAKALQVPFRLVEVHHFPDGESRVRLPLDHAKHIIFCRSLDRPNDKLVELFLASATARQTRATKLTLVAPYLCYMRQDASFHPGEAISQHIIGGHLATLFDEVITVDPHLHRTHQIEEAVPAANSVALSAAGVIGEFLDDILDGALLLGPDQESEQWVRAIAEPRGLDYAIAVKQRHGDRQVSLCLPSTPMDGRRVVLVDDIVSTGNTLATAARQAISRGAKEVHAVVTHALFADDALECLYEAGIEQVWSTDSVNHSSNGIPLAGLLAEQINNQLDACSNASPVVPFSTAIS